MDREGHSADGHTCCDDPSHFVTDGKLSEILKPDPELFWLHPDDWDALVCYHLIQHGVGHCLNLHSKLRPASEYVSPCGKYTALSIILDSTPESQRPLVAHLKFAPDIMGKLRDLQEAEKGNVVRGLQREYDESSFKDGTDTALTYYNHLLLTKRRLERFGVSISDEDMLHKFYADLPFRYAPLKSVVKTCGTKDLNKIHGVIELNAFIVEGETGVLAEETKDVLFGRKPKDHKGDNGVEDTEDEEECKAPAEVDRKSKAPSGPKEEKENHIEGSEVTTMENLSLDPSSREGTSDQDAARTAVAKNTAKNRKKKQKQKEKKRRLRELTCTVCQEKGHEAANCPRQEQEEESKNEPKVEEAENNPRQEQGEKRKSEPKVKEEAHDPRQEQGKERKSESKVREAPNGSLQEQGKESKSESEKCQGILSVSLLTSQGSGNRHDGDRSSASDRGGHNNGASGASAVSSASDHTSTIHSACAAVVLSPAEAAAAATSPYSGAVNCSRKTVTASRKNVMIIDEPPRAVIQQRVPGEPLVDPKRCAIFTFKRCLPLLDAGWVSSDSEPESDRPLPVTVSVIGDCNHVGVSVPSESDLVQRLRTRKLLRTKNLTIVIGGGNTSYTHRKDILLDYKPISCELESLVGGQYHAEGIGSILIKARAGKFTECFAIPDVHYVPNAYSTIIPDWIADQIGLLHKGELNNSTRRNGVPLFNMYTKRNLYRMETKVMTEATTRVKREIGGSSRDGVAALDMAATTTATSTASSPAGPRGARPESRYKPIVELDQQSDDDDDEEEHSAAFVSECCPECGRVQGEDSSSEEAASSEEAERPPPFIGVHKADNFDERTDLPHMESSDSDCEKNRRQWTSVSVIGDCAHYQPSMDAYTWELKYRTGFIRHTKKMRITFGGGNICYTYRKNILIDYEPEECALEGLMGGQLQTKGVGYMLIKARVSRTEVEYFVIPNVHYVPKACCTVLPHLTAMQAGILADGQLDKSTVRNGRPLFRIYTHNKLSRMDATVVKEFTRTHRPNKNKKGGGNGMTERVKQINELFGMEESSEESE